MKTLYAVIKNNLMVTRCFFISDSISESGNKVISLTRKIGSTPVTIYLEFVNDKVYIRPPRYTFHSAISHLDYTTEEQRWTRRKNVILGLVEQLQKASVWPFVANKDFFKMNESCTFLKSSSKHYKKGLRSVIQEQITEALSDGSRKSRREIKELDKKATQLLKKAG